MKSINILFLCLLIFACNANTRINKLKITHQLPEILKSKYDLLSKKESVIGYTHYQVCDEIENESLQYIRKNSSKEDLLWMLNDSCEKAFKLFVIEEIHRKHPNLDSTLLTKYKEDSTLIYFNTSCLGIGFQKEFREVCSNIIELNAFNKITAPKITNTK